MLCSCNRQSVEGLVNCTAVHTKTTDEKNLWSIPLYYSTGYFWTTFGSLLVYPSLVLMTVASFLLLKAHVGSRATTTRSPCRTWSSFLSQFECDGKMVTLLLKTGIIHSHRVITGSHP